MTDHGGVIIFLRQFNGVECFGKRADLIDLDQDRVGDVLLNSFAEEFNVRHEKIVADQLNFVAQPRRQLFPAVPIVFRTAIFDRDDRETRAKIGIIFESVRPPILSSRRIS